VVQDEVLGSTEEGAPLGPPVGVLAFRITFRQEDLRIGGFVAHEWRSVHLPFAIAECPLELRGQLVSQALEEVLGVLVPWIDSAGGAVQRGEEDATALVLFWMR